jgi:hypothetical protein
MCGGRLVVRFMEPAALARRSSHGHTDEEDRPFRRMAIFAVTSDLHHRLRWVYGSRVMTEKQSSRNQFSPISCLYVGMHVEIVFPQT